MPQVDVAQIKRLRGAIIEVLYARHQAQQSRVDHVALWHILRDLSFDLGENELLTVLQDLWERKYVLYSASRNRLSNRVQISQIQLTPSGRDLREETITDAAVQF
jgi:hypothetical protein